MVDHSGYIKVTFEAVSISVSIGGKSLLTDVSMRVRPGCVTALLGPNGAGKSSLLKVLSGDLAPDQGGVMLNGSKLAEMSLHQQSLSRCVMAQSSQIMFDFSVTEILRMGWPGAWSREAEHTLGDIAKRVAVDHLLKRKFNTLSGGEQQRAHFARVMMQIATPCRTPRYLLLDEPTSSLDVAHELLVLRLARQCATKNVGVLVILHDLNLAARIADSVVLMSSGRVQHAGQPGDVMQAQKLTQVYSTNIYVEHHAGLDRLLILT